MNDKKWNEYVNCCDNEIITNDVESSISNNQLDYNITQQFSEEEIDRLNNQLKSVVFYKTGSATNALLSQDIDTFQKTDQVRLIEYPDERNDGQIQEFNKYRRRKIDSYKTEIISLIGEDEYIDGEISQSELYMQEKLKMTQIDYVMEALMQLYYDNIMNVHILEGILMMISSVPYDMVAPKGQIMAIGLLSNKELVLRDRAIECFERWDSKKGISILKSLDCSPKWLQKYVDDVISDIEKDGVD